MSPSITGNAEIHLHLRVMILHNANDNLHDYKDFDAGAFYGKEFYGNMD